MGELTTVSQNVLDCVKRNAYGEIEMQISKETSEALMSGLFDLCGKISQTAFETVAKIYTEAIWAQVECDKERMKNYAEIMAWFNDQIDKKSGEVDLSDAETVNNFEVYCETQRKNFELKMKHTHKPNILGLLHLGRK